MYQKIMITTDGSETATRALHIGADLAKTLDSETLLLFVGDPATGERVLAEATAAAGLTGATRSVEGDAAEKILEVAESEGVDLIVVGNRGMKGARRLLGSVPNAISHHAPCNVLIVKTT